MTNIGSKILKQIINFFILFILISVLCMPVIAAGKATKTKKVKELEPIKIEYQAPDKHFIVSDFYLPLKHNKTISIPLIIMIHALGENKKAWKEYAKTFTEKGYSVLAVDLRGHGESIKDKKSLKHSWRTFTKEDWEKTYTDILSGIDYLKANHPQANTNKILIVGSSLGSSVAVISAEKEKKSVKGLILLSPLNKYKGIETRVPLVEFGNHPLMVIVSESDRMSYNAAKDLVKYAQGEHEIIVVKNAGHGIFMLKTEPKLNNIIYEWIDKHFPPSQVLIPKKQKGSKKKSSKDSSKPSH